jgi:hypothetical protein
MKKLLLTLILAVVSTSAMAEWVEVGSSVEYGITLYVEPITISKSENMVKMMRLTDFKTVQENAGKQYMSTKKQHEYDCKKERVRTLWSTFYSKNMGDGDVIADVEGTHKWTPVAPDSVGEAHLELACGK